MGIGGWASASGRRLTLLRDTRLLALAFAAGVVLIYHCARLPPLWWFLPGLMLCLVRWPGRSLLLAGLCGAGWALLLAQVQLGGRLPTEADGSIRVLAGHIAGLPQQAAFRSRFLFETGQSPRRVRLSWYDQPPPLRPGDCWRLTAKLSAPHGSANPGGFDYEAWLWRRGIGATGYVRHAQRCGDDAWTIDRWRARASAHIDQALAGAPSAAIIEGLTLGDTRSISDAQWQVMRRTGTTHLISVSGLHIGLIAGLIFFLLRWLVPRLPWAARLPALSVAALGAGGAALLYAALAGFSVPTQRSLWMVTVVLAAVMVRRRTAPSQLLALALVAVLVAHPGAVLAPGFWLSFGAVAWILYLVCGRVGGGRGWRNWLLLQPRLALALVPLSLLWFHQSSLVAPLANAIMIPAFSVLLPAALVSVLLVNVAPVLGVLPLHWVAQGLDACWQLLEWMAAWPQAQLTLATAPAWSLIVATAGVALLLAPRGVPARWLGVLALLPLLLVPAPPAPGGFRVVVVDVGQGLSVLVRTARHALLYDAGPRYRTGFNAGSALVLPFLKVAGVTRLDRVVISHADIDHRGGWPAIRDGMATGLAVGAGTGQPCRVGQHWRWDGVAFAMLNPADGEGGQISENNASCVLRIAGAGGSALLSGDIEAEAEQALLARSPAALAADLLVVPHHGSASSSTAAFVHAVAPTYAVVSAGWHNRWGFPRAPVVARYRAIGARLLNTALLGAIRVDFAPDGAPITVQARRREAGRFWQIPRP
ncbi:MAG: DNA internalization-related competence protein ComEC/Rec2 [Salinisphaera sp.]|nr:DNA internalization-related competence protein ComEC/Rec2 [Salinisphaera sp.]